MLRVFSQVPLLHLPSRESMKAVFSLASSSNPFNHSLCSFHRRSAYQLFFNSTKGSQAPRTLVYKALACKLPARLITKKSSTLEKDSQRFDMALKLANILLSLRLKDPSGLRQKASSINFWIVQIACQSHATGSSLQKKGYLNCREFSYS